MHISTVYLSTYTQEKPINGHCDINVDGTMVKIIFTDDEAAAIQAVCLQAWDRKQAAIAAAILNDRPDVKYLAPPTPVIEDADFDEVPF